MKLLTALFLITFTISAQDVELNHELQVTPIVIENTSIDALQDVNVILFIDDKTSIAKKKSYKNIIEKTLSGEKFLIFKAKREVKTC